MWYIPLFQKPHLPCHSHWHGLCFWGGHRWFLLKKHNHCSLLCSSLWESSFDFNNLECRTSNKLCFCVLCEIKEPENKFTESLWLILWRMVHKKIPVHNCKTNGLIQGKAELMAYSLCVVLNPAVKCCCKNHCWRIYSALYIASYH